MQLISKIYCCKRCKVEYEKDVLNELGICQKCTDEVLKDKRYNFRG